MATTETVNVNVTTNVAGVIRAGINELALLAPLDAGATISANVVRTYRRRSDAITDHGTGSLLANGVEAALAAGIPRVYAVGVTKTNVSAETYGDSDPVDDSGDTGADVLQNLPVYTVNSVNVDGTPMTTITYTSGDPLLLAPAADEIVINTSTGTWKAGTITSGAGAGVVFDYDYLDVDSALESLEDEPVEYLCYAGTPFSAETFGLYTDLLDYATVENKMVATAYESGVTAADVETITEAIRNGRLKLCAAHYTGDFTSAWAAATARAPINGTSKEQLAPSGITYTLGYRRSEFGDEETPTASTFHEFGANAIFKDRGGAFRISNDRASTALTDFERFHSTRRVIRFIENSMAEDLLALRRSTPTAIPYNQAGISAVEATLSATMHRMLTLGMIDFSSVTIPALADIPEQERLNRVLPDVLVNVRLAGQIHLFEIELEVSV